MIKEIFLFINTYYFINLGEYILHKISHNKNFGFLYKWHHYHHVIEFPYYQLTTDIYPQTNKLENIYIYFIILWWIVMYYILEFYYFNILFIESLIYVIWIDKMHESYHLNNSIFEKFEWFRKKKELHLLHHKKTFLNLNLFDFTSDKLLKTYEN